MERLPLDSESRIQAGDHQALKLWLRLLTCTNLVEGQLRQNMRVNFQSTLPRFDLLAQLDRSASKLSMGELSSLMMVSGGNVTGLVNQLVKEGWVSRTPLPTDKRTYLVGLTKKGKSHFDKMAEAHEQWVIGLFAELSPAQQETLMDLLSAMKLSVSASRNNPLYEGKN